MSATNTTITQENNNTINNALLDKLKNTFTDTQQQLFIDSFCMYLNHDQETDYIMDLDKVYSWLGFARKQDCKKLLVKHFQENIDYKIIRAFSKETRGCNEEAATAIAVAAFSKETCTKNIGGAGQNKETILI